MENSRELLLMIEAVAKEKSLPKDDIITILSESIEVALRKNFPEGAILQVDIDPETGNMNAWRLFKIVDSIDSENIEAEILQSEIDDEEVVDGYAWEKFDFKLTRQQFNIVKQVALQKIKNHSRDNYIEHLLNKSINIHSGTVKVIKKDFITVDTNGVDIIINKKNIPFREVYKNGDRIRFMIKEIGGHYVGDRASEDFLVELFKEEISSVEDGEVKIVACARNPGFRSKVIVSSDSGSRIDPVRVCIGNKGSHVKNIQQELNGEFIDIISYQEDPAQLLISAISPVNVTKIVMDEESKTMEIAVEDDGLALAIGRNGKNIDMISRLLGWSIKVYSETEWAEKEVHDKECLVKYFMFGLDCDNELADYIVDVGYSSLEEFVYLSVDEMDLEELDSETIQALKDNATETFNQKAKLAHAESIKTLYGLGFTSEEVDILIVENVLTIQDVADLSTYDLQDYLPHIDNDRAKSIILKSRQKISNLEVGAVWELQS